MGEKEFAYPFRLPLYVYGGGEMSDEDVHKLLGVLDTVAEAIAQDDDAEKELPFSEPSCPDGKEAEISISDDCTDWFRFSIPYVKSVIFSGPATTIMWEDGTKTTVKCASDQQFDKYAGFCACVCKKLFGSTFAAKRVMDENDVEKIRAAREAEKEKRRQQEAKNAMKNAGKSDPSFDEFDRDVKKRAYDLAVERLAQHMVDMMENSESIDHVTDDILKAMEDLKKEEE